MATAEVMTYDSEEDTPFQRKQSKNRVVLSDSDEETTVKQTSDVMREKSSDSEDSIKPETKKKKRIVRVASDSDDEIIKPSNTNSHSEEHSSPELLKKVKKTGRVKRNSSSDSENDLAGNDSQEQRKPKRVVASKEKFKDILFNKLHKKKTKSETKSTAKHKKSKAHSSSVSSSSSDSEEKSNLKSTLKEKVSDDLFTNKDLYDAESSDGSGVDEANISHKSSGYQDFNESEDIVGNGKTKKKKEKVNKPAQRKSSAEALEKIHAETQRLIRESNVSLPYFLPKQRSIAEFMQKRKPIPAIPLRGKGESLGNYINLYEERVKSIKEAYQQISDEEEEMESEEKEKSDEKVEENKENMTSNVVENEEKVETKTNKSVIDEENTKMDIERGSESDLTEKVNPHNDTAESKSVENDKDKSIDDVEMTETSSEIATSEISKQTKEKEVSDNGTDDEIETKRGENITNIENNGVNETNSVDGNIVESANEQGSNLKSEIQNIEISETKDEKVIDKSSKNGTNGTDECSKDSTKSEASTNKSEEVSRKQIEGDSSKSNQQKSSCESRKQIDGDSPKSNQQKSSCESQQKTNSESHQNECNIFSSLTESELMEEMEYAEELCEEIMNEGKSNPEQAQGIVKKKLFADFVDSIRPSDDEGSKHVSLKPGDKKLNDFIELDDFRPSSNLKPGVLKLMERFQKHVSTKPTKAKPQGQTVSVNITTTERNSEGEITGVSSEALSIVLEDNVDLDSSKHGPQCKPGAKLVKLKEELDKEMAKRREEAWKRRIEEAKMDEETYAGEKSDCQDIDEEFDEEENDLEDITTEEEEEEEEEIRERKKPRLKSAFVDEEAEVSEDGEGDDEDDEEEDEEEEEKEEKEDPKEEKKTRVKRAFLEDDDSENELEGGKKEDKEDGDREHGDNEGGEESPRSLKTKKKTFDMFLTQRNEDGIEGEEDDELPAYQRGICTEQSNAYTPAHEKVVFSPVVTLTGCDKTVSKNRADSSFLLDTQLSSAPSSPRLHHSPKKLNFDSVGTLDVGGLDNLLPTQSQTMCGEDLDAMFSGKFPTQSVQAEKLEENDERGSFVTQTQAPQGVGDLLGNSCSTNMVSLCSGAFSSQPIDPKQLELNDGTCDKFLTNSTEEAANTSSLPPQTTSLFLNKSSILSSDEDEDLDTSTVVKTKPRQRLVYSDDEEETRGDNGGGEMDESEIEDDGGTEDLEVEYDSEENEVVKPKVGDFFEAEAELSESEWGSEDEDENELDKMEQEEADREYHDTDKLKEELGKIHMRQQMDDDNREVKMLQEILLEDGELHSDGPGRQRQFKWSNLDDNSDLRMSAPLSGDEEEPEGEGEETKEDEAWRKARLDRELYLESQKDKLELQESLEDEEVNSAELAKTVILNDIKQKTVRSEPPVPAPSELPTKSPDSKLHALMGLHKKRGSYLSRGNQALVRLAKITQGVGDDVDSKIVKKKGNFVFTAVDPAPETIPEPLPESPRPDKMVQIKRKKSLATPPTLKKLKMHDGAKASVLSKIMSTAQF